MAPVRKRAAGTTTRPPPAAEQAWMASRIAVVQSFLPPASAPYLVMGNSRSGNLGGWIRERISAIPELSAAGTYALAIRPMSNAAEEPTNNRLVTMTAMYGGEQLVVKLFYGQ